MSEERDNSGVCFKNDKRTDKNRQPNYRGPSMIDGVRYEVSLWRKESQKLDKDGKKIVFLSLSYKKIDTEGIDQRREEF